MIKADADQYGWASSSSYVASRYALRGVLDGLALSFLTADHHARLMLPRATSPHRAAAPSAPSLSAYVDNTFFRKSVRTNRNELLLTSQYMYM